MNCNSACKECDRKVYVSAITFAADTLTLNFPDTMSYVNGRKYCFVLTTPLPDAATVNAPVVVTVGDGTTEFPQRSSSSGRGGATPSGWAPQLPAAR